MVSTWTQPDFTSQTGTVYKAAIDGGLSIHHRVAGGFVPHAQSTPDMTVRVDAGSIPQWQAKPLEVAAQSTSAITAPVGNPRKDIIYVDARTGAVGVATGTPGASPSDPAIPAGAVAVARVTLQTSSTAITNNMIDDLRAPQFLGLGTGAVLDVDTDTSLSANSDSRLPSQKAVRAYVLANSMPQSVLDRIAFLEKNLAVNTLRDQIDAGWSVLKMVDGVADEFEDETGIATKTNATYDATGDYYHNPGGYSVTNSFSGKTVTASRSDYSGASVLTDGTANATGWGFTQSSGFPQYFTVDCGADVALGRIVLAVNQNISGGGYAGPNSVTITAATNAAPATFNTITTQVIGNASDVYAGDLTAINFGSSTARYWRVTINSAVAAATACSMNEAKGYAVLSPSNMTLVSFTATADTTPTEARLVLLHQAVDAVTLNTDCTIEASRDGGTTWTAGTLTNQGAFDASTNILSATVDLSAQPAGTSMKWRFKTLNAKSQRLHGVWMQWR